MFGVAVLTVVANSVTDNNGGQDLLPARLRGYQASYYGAIAWAALATLISSYLVFSHYHNSNKSVTVVAAQATTAADVVTVEEKEGEGETLEV